jgi:RHH-type proline utilization regulon transcriptional repressor/proline dehydrogenase/delta 1-pyrroline-5-carboxylate dehydrogenase
MEREIQALALRLLKAAREREPLTLSPRWWQERLLAWATQDPDFRVKLLRFVDVLPALRDASAVSDHVRQYFRDGAPPIVQIGSELAAPPIFRPVLSRVVREGVYSMAHRFIAGESATEAVPRLAAMAASGVGYTADLLGEATLSEREADSYAERYREVLQTLAGAVPPPSGEQWIGVPPANVSVKLSSLTAEFEPAAPRRVSEVVRRRLMPLLLLARDRNAFINVDMEQYRYKELVHQIFRDAALAPEIRDFGGLGIVVQAYLKDAEADIGFLRDLARQRGTPITVRLVKGAYWEEERIVAGQNSWPVPVYEDKVETDASFERCTDLLLSAWPDLHAAFGSHNPRSVAQAMVKSRERGLAGEVEFEMLFGMAETLREAVVAEGLRTRAYVPIGAVIPGMAYLVRRLLENTSNQSWFVRGALEVEPEEAVAAPVASRPLSRERPVGTFLNAPVAAFHLSEVRDEMGAALARARSRFGHRQPLLLADRQEIDRPLAEVRFPADPETLLGHVAQATPDDVEAAVAGAVDHFAEWRDLGVGKRAEILRHAADLLEASRFDLAALMVFESAKPWREADGDVTEACDYLRYYAGQSERLLAPLPMNEVLGEENTYLREARGVTAVIAPWNFPLAIITGMTAAALAAGNCAVLKPAAQSPLVAARLVEILRAAGVPAGVVQYLPGPGSVVGQALVEHPLVDTIAFTGSKEVGMALIAAAARLRPGQRSVKRVIAEMGGKNAIIVDDDADLDQAVSGVLASAFGYAGQKCSACSRLIVVGSAYEETIERLAAGVESLTVGSPVDPETFVPPVISAGAQERIDGYVKAGKMTATLIAQGTKPAEPGYYVSPTVFTDVPAADPLAREEIFGPVLSVFRAANMRDALDLALDSEFALTGGLFSRNPRHIELARREFRVGNLYINRKVTGAVVGRQPFGGLAHSGAGDKAGGPDYLMQFLQPRTVTENTTRRGFAPDTNRHGGI